MSALACRPARPDDAFALMRLYQVCEKPLGPDDVFLDLHRLEAELAHRDSIWIAVEREGRIEACLSAAVERGNRLGKLQRMIGDAGGLEAACRWLARQAGEIGIDVLYSTTRTLTLAQQAVTIACGFRVLGVFPTAISADEEGLNGLTVWHRPGVLEEARRAELALHPVISPFYELARVRCGLPAAQAAPLPRIEPESAVGPMELIEAPLYVASRFERLRARRQLSVNFYPFQSPDALITSPDQSIEVFVRLVSRMRFASILGERLAGPVQPVSLYRRIGEMLYARGVHYIEVINDAADVYGIECILRAGFAPCGYFPALFLQGDARRDFVVFAKSFEYFHYAPETAKTAYGDFLREFCRVRAALPARDHADAVAS